MQKKNTYIHKHSLLRLIGKRLSCLLSHLNTQSGFTILELMVVFSLSAVIAGGGFFAFTKYSQSQAFNHGIDQLKLVYDQARNSAISNVKPGQDCTDTSTLKGYRVDLDEDTLTLVIECLNGGVQADVTKDDQLPSRVKLSGFEACSGVEYQVITGNVVGTSGSLPCTMEIYHEADSTNLKKELVIGVDGRMSVK